jgi:hypothetical protein
MEEDDSDAFDMKAREFQVSALQQADNRLNSHGFHFHEVGEVRTLRARVPN